MSTAEKMPTRLSRPQRRKIVELGVKAGKSNRAIAKELDVDEGTIRRDRKFLATSEDKGPVKMPPPRRAKLKLPVRELRPDERRRLQQQDMLKVVQLWITREGLILPDLESFVLPEAGKLLHYHRHSQNRFPVPTRSPDELLPLTRPTYAVEDYMPAKLSFCAHWLARWLACCLPREEELQDEMLREISIRTRSQ